MRAYTADMIPGGASPVINVSQYDNDYAVTVTIIEGAEIYTPPAGATIRVEGTKPDGHGFEYPCTYQGNVVTMPIYTQMTVVSGRFPIELVVYQNGLRVGSCNIIFAVEKAPLGEDTDISETVIPDIIDAAQSSAEAAQEAAETAQEAAAQVLSSQIVTDASGSIASFSDGADDVAVKSLAATITPVQNLNGQANPYPPGGGKNKVPYPTIDKTVSGITYKANEDGSISVTGTATAEVSQGIGDPFTLPAGTYIYSSGLTESFSTYDSYVSIPGTGTIARGNSNAPGPQFTLTETSQVTINIRVRSGQTVNLTVKPMIRLASVSDGTYAPYSNICPISGRTGMTVTRCGRNLGKITLNSIADADIGDGSYTLNGLTFSFTKVSDNGVSEIVVNGTPTARATSMLNRNLLAHIPPGRYILSGCPSGGALSKYRLTCWDNTTSATLANDFGSGATFELVEGHNVNFAIDISASMAGGTISNLVFKPMIRLASDSNDAYEPYNGASFPITWETEAGTVYGGTLDVVSGVLTVDKYLLTCGETITPTGSSYAYATNPNRWQIALSGDYMPSEDKMGESISDTFGYYNGGLSQWADGTFRFSAIQSGGYRLIQFKWADQPTTVEDLKALLAENPIHFVIPLATPQTYQLTPTEVRTLLGGNNIYTDAGDVSVEYVADTKMYIDNKIAALQALVLEN